MTYYFAYGSNLKLNQLQSRCPKVSFMKKHILEDYKLIFDRVASIEHSIGDSVKGVIFKLSDSDEASLDRFEGVSSKIYKKIYFEVKLNYKVVKVMTYVKIEKESLNPSKEYLTKIIAGYKFWNYEVRDLIKVETEKKKEVLYYSNIKNDKYNNTSLLIEDYSNSYRQTPDKDAANLFKAYGISLDHYSHYLYAKFKNEIKQISAVKGISSKERNKILYDWLYSYGIISYENYYKNSVDDRDKILSINDRSFKSRNY